MPRIWRGTVAPGVAKGEDRPGLAKAAAFFVAGVVGRVAFERPADRVYGLWSRLRTEASDRKGRSSTGSETYSAAAAWP